MFKRNLSYSLFNDCFLFFRHLLEFTLLEISLFVTSVLSVILVVNASYFLSSKYYEPYKIETYAVGMPGCTDLIAAEKADKYLKKYMRYLYL